jgi:hypothetical protein
MSSDRSKKVDNRSKVPHGTCLLVYWGVYPQVVTATLVNFGPLMHIMSAIVRIGDTNA